MGQDGALTAPILIVALAKDRTEDKISFPRLNFALKFKPHDARLAINSSQIWHHALVCPRACPSTLLLLQDMRSLITGTCSMS